MTDDPYKMLNKSLAKLENVAFDIKRRKEELEDQVMYLEGEIDRLGEKIQDMEMEKYDSEKIYRMVEKLYISKITLSPMLFDQELKNFFRHTIDRIP